MRSLVSVLALAAAANLASAALPSNCIGQTFSPNSPTSQLLKPGRQWQCALLQAGSGSVNILPFSIDATSFGNYVAPQLEIVVWHAGNDASNGVFAVTAGQPAFNSKGVFFLVTPTTDVTGSTDPSVFQNRAILPGGAVWSTTDGWQLTSGTNTFQVASRLVVPEPCVGAYNFYINAKAWPGGSIGMPVNTGVLWRIVDGATTTTSLLNAGSVGLNMPATLSNNEWMPGNNQIWGRVVGQNFAYYKYMVQSLTLQASGVGTLFDGSQSSILSLQLTTQGGSPGAVWGSQSGPNSFRNMSGSTGIITATYSGHVVDYLPRSSAASDPTIFTATGTGSQVTAGSYAWYSYGPFVDVTINIAGVQEFPMLAGSNSFSVAPSNSFWVSSRIYMIMTSDPTVFEHALVVSGLQAPSVNSTISSAQNVPLPLSLVSVSSLVANPTAVQSPSAMAGAAVFTPAHMTTFYSPGSTPLSGQATQGSLPVQLSGMSLSRPYVYFVKVSYNGQCPGSTVVTIPSISGTLTYSAARIMGECLSNSDCVHPSGSHPSSQRASLSANGDVSRFSQCMMIFNSTGVGTSIPSTMCTECTPGGTNTHLECRGGQFCASDLGLCGAGTSLYTCDTESAGWYGVCRNKTSQALGQRCRNINTGVPAGPPSSSGTPGMISGGTLTPATVGAVFPSLLADNGFAPGEGFCGEVRYYNNTGDGSSVFSSNTPSTFQVNNTVRTLLWTGSCYQGRCMECDPQAFPSSPGGSAMNCINGRFMDPVTVDNTVRTLVMNSTASALVALCFFVLFLLTAQLCSMQNDTNRHRELFGQGPMTCFEVLGAVLFGWMCCCKKSTPRTGARYGSEGSTSAPTAGAVANPLEKARDW